MATSSGTSVFGIQAVISGVATSDQNFAVVIDGLLSTPPSRLGFYYLVRYRLTTGLEARVVQAGAVFRPGRRFFESNVTFDAAFRYRIWVDWNFPGLSWTCNTGM